MKVVAGMNQYKGGKGSDRQFFLTAHSGMPWSIDRKLRGRGGPCWYPRMGHVCRHTPAANSLYLALYRAGTRVFQYDAH